MSTSRVEIEAFDFIDQVTAATTADDILASFAKELGKFGFTNFLITDMPPPSFGLKGRMILNGWSKVWFERYTKENFYRHDPMAKHTRETINPFFWDEVQPGALRNLEARRVMDEAAACGLKKGFSVPIFGAEGDLSCVTMGGMELSIPPHAREAIHLTSIYAHDRTRALRCKRAKRTRPSAGRKLTEREREVLKWVARGKTDWEIGEILHISKETSFAHVRNSCRKLDAVTRTQAVVRAMVLGEIII